MNQVISSFINLWNHIDTVGSLDLHFWPCEQFILMLMLNGPGTSKWMTTFVNSSCCYLWKVDTIGLSSPKWEAYLKLSYCLMIISWISSSWSCTSGRMEFMNMTPSESEEVVGQGWGAHHIYSSVGCGHILLVLPVKLWSSESQNCIRHPQADWAWMYTQSIMHSLNDKGSIHPFIYFTFPFFPSSSFFSFTFMFIFSNLTFLHPLSLSFSTVSHSLSLAALLSSMWDQSFISR